MNGGPFDPNGKPPYPGAPNYGQPAYPPADPSQAQGYGSPPNYGQQPQQPPQAGFGTPGYPPPQGYGAPGGYPAPNAYAPPPGGYGAPQQPYAPQPYGQPNYAANPYAAPMTPYGAGMPGPPGMQGPASDINPGLFGAIPCPTCGMATNARADGAAVGFFVAGIPGWLIASALMTKYHCPQHGEVPAAYFPPNHQSSITNRKIAKIVGAVGVPLLLVGFFVLIAALN